MQRLLTLKQKTAAVEAAHAQCRIPANSISIFFTLESFQIENEREISRVGDYAKAHIPNIPKIAFTTYNLSM